MPDSATVVDWVRSCARGCLVIVDSLAAFHGGDQNDAGEMRTFMHRCRRLADLGASVIVIHHDGKAETSKDYRGSSDFKAAIDIGLHVSNVGADRGLDRLLLRPFKTRIQVEGPILYNYAGGQFICGERQEAGESISDRLTAILRLNPGITSNRFETLAKQQGLGRNRARSFLADGLIARSIRRETGPNNVNRHVLVENQET